MFPSGTVSVGLGWTFQLLSRFQCSSKIRICWGKSTRYPDGCVRNLSRCWGQLGLMGDDVTPFNKWWSINTFCCWDKISSPTLIPSCSPLSKAGLFWLISGNNHPSPSIRRDTIMYVPHPHRISTYQDVCLSKAGGVLFWTMSSIYGRSPLALRHEGRDSAAALECGNVCFCSSSRSLLPLRPNRLDRRKCLCVGVVSGCIPSWGEAESAENVRFSGLTRIMCLFSWNISGMSKSGTYLRELKPHWRVVVFSHVVRTSALLMWSGWLKCRVSLD